MKPNNKHLKSFYLSSTAWFSIVSFIALKNSFKELVFALSTKESLKSPPQLYSHFFLFFRQSLSLPNRIYSWEVLTIIFSLGRLSLFEKSKGRFKDVIVFPPFYNHADHKQHFASLGLGSHWGSTGGHWSPASLTLLHLPNQPNFNSTLHPLTIPIFPHPSPPYLTLMFWSISWSQRCPIKPLAVRTKH